LIRSVLQGLVNESLLSPAEIGLFVDTCAPDSGATQFRFSCPSTQLAIRVPHLGLHFSPARYSRFMLILHALEGVNQLEEGLDAEKNTTMPVQWQHGTTLGRLRFYLGGYVCSLKEVFVLALLELLCI
jgi:hypothetical protein